jgi:hypothetical protein
MRTRLWTPAGVAGGVVAGIALGVSNVIIWIARGPLGLLNDFYVYWSAAAVLNQGGNPYDAAALARVHDAAGVPGLLGNGYSYPLLFAQLLRPLALLPAHVAGGVFMALSLLAVALAVALLLGSVPDLRLSWALPLGALGGLFPPVSYGLWNGQANDLLLPLLAMAYRGTDPGAWLALAAAVKLYPASGLLALAGRRDRLRQLGLAAVFIGVPALAAELAVRGGAGGVGPRVTGFLSRDSYWSNQSVNGWLSRLALSPSWPLGGVSVELADAVFVAALVFATLAVLWRCRFRPWEGALALSIWLGAIIAPKNSLWNFAPMLLCFAYGVPHSRRSPWLAAALLAGLLLTGGQLVVWAFSFTGATVPESLYASPLAAWASSVGFYGGLVIGAATARLLLLDARVRSSSPARPDTVAVAASDSAA